MTKKLNILATFVMLLACLTFSTPTIHANGESYNIHEACNMTRYKDLCIKSLASHYSNNAKWSLTKWTRAGVSVTIGEVKSVSKYLNYLKGHNNNNSHSHVAIRGSRNRAALFDCVECIQETLYSLRISLDSLRRLSVGEFEEQMSDVVTWLSAALTGEDTCIDGFEGRRGKGVTRLCNKVKNASYVTANALALATELVHAGPKTLGGDGYP